MDFTMSIRLVGQTDGMEAAVVADDVMPYGVLLGIAWAIHHFNSCSSALLSR
jgi:hypothetical protein